MARPPAQKDTLPWPWAGEHAKAVPNTLPAPLAEHGDAEQPRRGPACGRGAASTPVSPPLKSSRASAKDRGVKPDYESVSLLCF